MGAEQSTQSLESQNFSKNLRSNYQFQREVTDRRFGDIQIYKHKSDDLYLAKKGKLSNSTEDFNDYMKKANSRKQLNHRNLLRIQGIQDANEDTYCGDFNKITLYFEYYFLDLQKELERRRLNSEYLKETEMWYLLDSLISVGYYLQQQNIYHGDYQPSTILLNNEGEVKIADSGILTNEQSNYFRVLSGSGQALLSPIQMESLRNKETAPHHDFWKSDIYSLGMTLLEVATLAPSFHCYDFASQQIVQPKVQQLLQNASVQYGSFLVSIIRDMINPDENLRPNFVDLNAVLLPFQQQIQNFEPIPDQRQRVQQQPQVSRVQPPIQQSQVYRAPPQSVPYTGQPPIQRPPQYLQQSQPIYAPQQSLPQYSSVIRR